MYLLTGAICIKMQEKLIQKYQIWDHTGSNQKQLQAYEKEYRRLSSYKRIIREDHQNCLKNCLQEEMGNFFVEKEYW